ncbi:hypothetical protein GUJ93_ZPchr0006g42863 [Zizania palustris]|uniref:Uncharacterized protein n=1 Tax=Zizania palustris TaxID=103762 RepID=A0A8J5W448_ZIZPA|nr:hypothetical protein GUJ93_ZPchr0006g42863 [Zizania palustris]
MRASGGEHEEADGDAADLQVLPQCVRDVGPPDRPRHLHDRRAPASSVLLVVVPVAMMMVVVVAMAVAVVVVVMIAVGSGREGQRAMMREEERRLRR